MPVLINIYVLNFIDVFVRNVELATKEEPLSKIKKIGLS